MKYINEDVKFWKHSYSVQLSPLTDCVYVNADNEQDALDFAVDHAEERGYIGLFLDPSEIASYEDDVIYAGNHCHALIASEVYITRWDD